MINCNTSTCESSCQESLLESNCVVLENDLCFVNNCNSASNGCSSVVTLSDYIIGLGNELIRLKTILKCMTDIYCAPPCNLLITNINIST